MVTFQWKISCLMVRAVNRLLQAVAPNGGEEPEVDLLIIAWGRSNSYKEESRFATVKRITAAESAGWSIVK